MLDRQLNAPLRYAYAALAALFFAGTPARAAPASLAELERMYTADQAARTPAEGKPIDWSKVIVEDAKRRQRVKQLIARQSLSTGQDFQRAAMILQHGSGAADYLLAHDLAVIALIKGDYTARWLSAATLDRYLRAIGMPQRFGTQSIISPGKPRRLGPVDPAVPDSLRRELRVPPLARALDRDAPSPAPQPNSPEALAAASEELRQMLAEHEADMQPGESPDWSALTARREARRVRTKTLLTDGLLASGADFHHAAILASTGNEPEEHLTAHDLAVIAIGRGETRAALTAAEALDRFLQRTARPQRYATQIEMRYPDPPRLYPVDPDAPDFLRVQYGAPTMVEARKREAEAVRKARKTKAVFAS